MRRKATIWGIGLLWLTHGAAVGDATGTEPAAGGTASYDIRLLTVAVTSGLGPTATFGHGTAVDATLGQLPQEVVDVHLPTATPTEVAGSWQIVIYFDGPLTTPDGLRKAALVLARESDRLVDLGSVEVILADPHPHILLEASRNPLALDEALHDVRSEAVSIGELVWLRQRHIESSAAAEDSHSLEALQREIELIATQRRSLISTLGARTSPRPKLLILVSNGFDLNPRAFYGQSGMQSFLEDPRSPLSHVETSRSIAADGWTSLVVALGPRATQLDDPFAPLLELARATGGELLTRRREIAEVLSRAATWPLVKVRLVAPTDELLPFALTAGAGTLQLGSIQWAATRSGSILAELTRTHAGPGGDTPFGADRPVLRLLRPEGLSLTGPVKFRTVAGRQRIHRVAFLLDDRLMAEAERSPYAVEIDLGAEVRPCTVTAIAYSRSGRELGRDSLSLNMALEPPRVTIDHLNHDADEGTLEIVASATAPTGTPPDEVRFFYNQSQVGTFDQPPYRLEVGVEQLGPSDIVRVVARYPDGTSVESATLPGADGPIDQLEVNLVELLAMVTPHTRTTDLELDRTDFVIRRQGRPLSIDQFSRWEELPLTLGLMLDTSDSMNEALADVREAGERFFHDALRLGDEAFVVDFNELPRLVRHTTTDSELLLDSLESLDASGMTALYDAIVFGLQQFKRSDGRRALVVVTDGEDSASYYQPRECIRQARLNGVPIYLIVLGPPPDPHREPYLLRNLALARRTGGEVYYVSDIDDLTHIYEQVGSELRRQYFLGFDAGHILTPAELEEIEIEVVREGVTVRTLLASQQRGG